MSPYAYEAFRFFLKSCLSGYGTCKDQNGLFFFRGYSFYILHDFHFIPREQDGQRLQSSDDRWGLGAQAILAQTAYEFLRKTR